MSQEMKSHSLSEIENYWALGDEWANWLTHGLGLILSFIALFFLIAEVFTVEAPLWELISYSVYGICLVILYAVSTLYHGAKNPPLKHFLRLLDHCAIYIFIAGSYTPFALIAMQGVWGWSMFGVIWSLALFGIVFKIFFIGKFERLSTFIYLAMGWLVVIAIEPLLNSVPLGGFYWLAAGGMFYTFGVIFFIFDKIKYFHAIWHLFVMGGSCCHFFAIYHYV